MEEHAYSDVVREAQELVELALKALLRHVGAEPPRWHDVGSILLQQRDKFPSLEDAELTELMRISAWLRKEREFSFYGDIDFIPTENYTEGDGAKATADAEFVVAVVSRIVGFGDPLR